MKTETATEPSAIHCEPCAKLKAAYDSLEARMAQRGNFGIVPLPLRCQAHKQSQPYAKKLEATNLVRLYVASMGKIFRVNCIANGMAEANEFCRKNPDNGVIAEDKSGHIFCATLYGSVCPSALLADV